MDKLNGYIDRILEYTDLTPADSRRVRGEVTYHL